MIRFLIAVLVIGTINLYPTSPRAETLARIQEKGYMEIAVYESFPPFSYKSDEGKIVGIDVDLGRAIARELGVTAGFRLFQADESLEDDLRNVVWKGHYIGGGVADMMLHVPYDLNFAKQVKQVTFITPYYSEELVFALDRSRLKNANTLKVFIKEKIGVETATLADDYLLQAFAGRIRENVLHYRTVAEAVVAMQNKEVTAVMGTRSEVENSVNQSDEKFQITKLPTPGLPIEGWDLGAAVKAEHTDLADAVKRALTDLRESGAVAEIFAQHGVTYNPPTSLGTLSASSEKTGDN